MAQEYIAGMRVHVSGGNWMNGHDGTVTGRRGGTVQILSDGDGCKWYVKERYVRILSHIGQTEIKGIL